VTVSLEGPLQGGFSALPSRFTYRVVSGTGAYAHLTDQGTLHLTLRPNIVVAGGGPIRNHLGGTFTLTI
jgi:hypothetical protein